MRILIADDNPQMRAMVRAVVSNLDPVVDEAADGADALRRYDLAPPDWVLMDIAMRPMDGLEATRELLRRDPRARVLIVTEHDDGGLRREAAAAGALGYVLKEDLFEILDYLAPPLSG